MLFVRSGRIVLLLKIWNKWLEKGGCAANALYSWSRLLSYQKAFLFLSSLLLKNKMFAWCCLISENSSFHWATGKISSAFLWTSKKFAPKVGTKPTLICASWRCNALFDIFRSSKFRLANSCLKFSTVVGFSKGNCNTKLKEFCKNMLLEPNDTNFELLGIKISFFRLAVNFSENNILCSQNSNYICY